MRKYAVIDLETTGPKYESGDRIFQFGCTLIDGDEVIEYVSLNINPEKSNPIINRSDECGCGNGSLF